MPEDWRTLVDVHLYSINTNMVPEVIPVKHCPSHANTAHCTWLTGRLERCVGLETA